MADFLEEQYQLPPAVFPPRSLGVVSPGALPPASVPPSAAGARGIVPVFDSRPKNALDIYREFTNTINFTVPQGFTFILRKVKAASYSDTALTKPVAIESGLLLSVTVNGINTLLSDPDYGFASNFDAPVFITIPETQVLGGFVLAKAPLLPGTFNAWVAVSPQPTATTNWGRTINQANMSMTVNTGAAVVAITPDGKNFTYSGLPVIPRDVAVTNGVWLITSSSSGAVYTSTDGLSWALHAYPVVAPTAACGANGRFVVGDSSGTHYSDNYGGSWTASNALPGLIGGTFPEVIIWNPDAALYVLYTSGAQIYSSPDGITWTLKYSGATGAFIGLAYGNGVYLCCFNIGGSGICRSTDLVNWTNVLAINLGTSQYASPFKYNNGMWRTVAVVNVEYYSTDDGLTWISNYSPSASSGSIGAIDDLFYELAYQGGVSTGYYLTVQSAAQAARGGLTMKFAIEGQLIPNNALPANMAVGG